MPAEELDLAGHVRARCALLPQQKHNPSRLGHIHSAWVSSDAPSSMGLGVAGDRLGRQ